jgi:hypothetical protein
MVGSGNVKEVDMPTDLAAGAQPVRRRAVIVVAALLLLLSAPGATAAADAPPPRPAMSSDNAAGVRSDTPARTTTSTTRTSRQPSGDSANVALPLILAALVLLALLGPPTGYHSHGHWHHR